jgi:hypothetical protein
LPYSDPHGSALFIRIWTRVTGDGSGSDWTGKGNRLEAIVTWLNPI